MRKCMCVEFKHGFRKARIKLSFEEQGTAIRLQI